MPPADALQDVRTSMVILLERIGVAVEAHHHEVATGGQGEIEKAPLTRMADNVMIYKYVVKNVALPLAGCSVGAQYSSTPDILARVEPFKREFAVFDPLDGCEPEALEFAFFVPIGGQNPRADPKGFSSGGAIRLAEDGAARVAGAGCERDRARAGSFVFCSRAVLAVDVAFSGSDNV